MSQGLKYELPMTRPPIPSLINQVSCQPQASVQQTCASESSALSTRLRNFTLLTLVLCTTNVLHTGYSFISHALFFFPPSKKSLTCDQMTIWKPKQVNWGAGLTDCDCKVLTVYDKFIKRTRQYLKIFFGGREATK